MNKITDGRPILLMLIFCAFAHSLELNSYEQTKFWAFKTDCLEENKWTTDDLLKMFVESSYTELGCMLECIYVKSGIMNRQGVMSLNKVAVAADEEYDREDIFEVSQKCLRGLSEEPCEWAMHVHYCYFERWYDYDASSSSSSSSSSEESEETDQRPDESKIKTKRSSEDDEGITTTINPWMFN